MPWLDPELLGLYVGSPCPERTRAHADAAARCGVSLPSGNLEQVAEDRDELLGSRSRSPYYHEIAIISVTMTTSWTSAASLSLSASWRAPQRPCASRSAARSRLAAESSQQLGRQRHASPPQAVPHLEETLPITPHRIGTARPHTTTSPM
jgi:hypothetical protein